MLMTFHCQGAYAWWQSVLPWCVFQPWPGRIGGQHLFVQSAQPFVGLGMGVELLVG